MNTEAFKIFLESKYSNTTNKFAKNKMDIIKQVISDLTEFLSKPQNSCMTNQNIMVIKPTKRLAGPKGIATMTEKESGRADEEVKSRYKKPSSFKQEDENE